MKSKPPSLKIYLYEWDGDKDYGYAVICEEVTILKFIYKGKIHSQRILSDFESDLLQKRIKLIKLDLLPEVPEFPPIQCPSITTLVEIKSQFTKVTLKWETNDELASKKSFAGIKKFIETVHEMLIVDFSDLDMPVYL